MTAEHDGNNLSEKTWLNWLVKARILAITFVLGIQLAVVSFTPTNVSVLLFVSLIVAWYAVAVFFLLLHRLWSDARLQARIQVLADLAFSTGVVYVSGGVDSNLTVLYPVLIIVAAIVLPRYWAYLTAALSFICFGVVLELSYFQLVHSYSVSRPDPNSLQATILISLGTNLAIAYLASFLSHRLRQVGVRLEEQSGELQNLQALHGDIVNCISGGLITTDMAGRMTLVNPAAERILERSSAQLLGHDASEFLSDRVAEMGPTGIRYEAHATTPSGTQKVVGLTVSPLNVPSRGVAGYIYSFNDLTDMKRLEREVRIRDRMSAVGRLASGIAHEIRNPLSSIAGSAKMLRDSATLDEDERKLMDVVKRESERLNAIVTDFLFYSREKEYRFQKLDLVVLLKEAVSLLRNRPEATGDGAAAKVEIIEDFSVTSALAMAAGDRLKQVFWNICDNAIRAMRSGGTLTLSLKPVANNWEIAFSDTGVGIRPQQLEKVFEPFQSGFEGGTGLGLALVYQIVQAHQGEISVQSAPGEGTTFRVRLKQVMDAEVRQDAVDNSAVALAGSTN